MAPGEVHPFALDSCSVVAAAAELALHAGMMAEQVAQRAGRGPTGKAVLGRLPERLEVLALYV